MRSRRYGGDVNSFSSMGSQPYQVGEAGPEQYVSDSGQTAMVGMGGPEIRTFPQDGYIVPNHELGGMGRGGPMRGMGGPGMMREPRQGYGGGGSMRGMGGPMVTLSKMADGNFGMESDGENEGQGRGDKRIIPSRGGLAFRGQNPAER